MIEFSYGKYHTPVCDGCGAELPRGFGFEDAVDAMRAAGWRSVKLGQDWLNYCPDCDESANAARPGFED